jgi:hypothetical protein
LGRFIGLTPGVLVSVGVYRWLKGVFTGRKGVKQFARQGQLLLILRYVTWTVAGSEKHMVFSSPQGGTGNSTRGTELSLMVKVYELMVAQEH